MNPARPSSAVILLREEAGDTEVFLGKRHGRATFASTFVFPGGVLEPEDALVHQHCRGVDRSDADRRLSVASGGLDYFSAAIRELFEETGVLLATDTKGEWIAKEADRRVSLSDTRQALYAGELSWAETLSSWSIKLATNQLHYVGHWETPVVLSARFSTRFFLADLPPGQEPKHDGKELIDSRWLTPTEALRLHKIGEIELPFPHMKHLQMLASFSTPQELRHWARERWREPIVKVRPWIIEGDGERKFILPWEPGYPDNA